MSKHNQTVQVEVPSDRLLLFCQEVFQEFGWRVQEVSGSGMTAKEVAPQVTGFAWPARIDIEIQPRGSDGSELKVYGSITGMGPIQSNHLKGQIGRFLNSLSVRIDTAQPKQAPSGAGTLGSELRELAELHAGGVLTDDEFQAAKARLLGG